ncbi:hypothetical protein CR513_23636, partial [Mucuna pruriens]
MSLQLVTKGFKKIHGIDYDETFSLVIMLNLFRSCLLLLHIIIMRYDRWISNSLMGIYLRIRFNMHGAKKGLLLMSRGICLSKIQSLSTQDERDSIFSFYWYYHNSENIGTFLSRRSRRRTLGKDVRATIGRTLRSKELLEFRHSKNHVPIFGSGSIQLHPSLSQHNVLHVPNVDNNLISIYGLTQDLKCVVTFFILIVSFKTLPLRG